MLKKYFSRYRLGKCMEENLEHLPAFENAYIVKESNYVPQFVGTVHTLVIIKDDKLTEFSKLKI